jgi:hypothetical protein
MRQLSSEHNKLHELKPKEDIEYMTNQNNEFQDSISLPLLHTELEFDHQHNEQEQEMMTKNHSNNKIQFLEDQHIQLHYIADWQ